MKYTTLIDIEAAFQHLKDQNWAFIDCRFSLNEVNRGSCDYQKSHIPGALYAHLNNDLSGVIIPGKTGRHPLPDKQILAQKFSKWGIDLHTQVIAYDDLSGHMAAARLWWLLKWAGHDAVAVLDGGFKYWIGAGYPCSGGIENSDEKVFITHFNPDIVSTSDEVMSILNNQNFILLDSRTFDRYKGENETIDPIAGHIPSAISAPYTDNIKLDGLIKSSSALKGRFGELVGNKPAHQTIFYCGSGVTAAHNILAFVHAGMGMPRLYAGSWSDWITNPSRPIIRGI